MRRLNPIATRLGFSASWMFHSKIYRVSCVDPWLLSFQFYMQQRVSNLQVSRLKKKLRLIFKKDSFFRSWLFYRRRFRRLYKKKFRWLRRRRFKKKKSAFKSLFFSRKLRKRLRSFNSQNARLPLFFYFPRRSSLLKRKRLVGCQRKSLSLYRRSLRLRQYSFFKKKKKLFFFKFSKKVKYKKKPLLRKMTKLAMLTRSSSILRVGTSSRFLFSFVRRKRYFYRLKRRKSRRKCRFFISRKINKFANSFKKIKPIFSFSGRIAIRVRSSKRPRFKKTFFQKRYFSTSLSPVCFAVSSFCIMRLFSTSRADFANKKFNKFPKARVDRKNTKNQIFQKFVNSPLGREAKTNKIKKPYKKKKFHKNFKSVNGKNHNKSSNKFSKNYNKNKSYKKSYNNNKNFKKPYKKKKFYKPRNKRFYNKKFKTRKHGKFFKNRFKGRRNFRWRKRRVRICFSRRSWLRGRALFWLRSVSSLWSRTTSFFKKGGLRFAVSSPSLKFRRYFRALYSSEAFRSSRLSFLLKRSIKVAKLVLQRRGFRRRRFARLVRLKTQLRRRFVFFNSIIFSRSQLTPRWNSRKWLMPPLQYYIRRLQKRGIRLKGFYARRRKRIALRFRFARGTLRRFNTINAVERQLDGYKSIELSGMRSLPVLPCTRNAQLYFFTSPAAMRLLYQSTVYKKLARLPRRMRSYSFFSSLLNCAFFWRNTLLLTSVLSVEFRRTRYHYRFFKLFSKYLRLFLSSRATVVNLIIRVRGCFGKIARTRSLFLQPLARFHVPISFNSLHSPVRFSFRNIVTRRGVFGLALWIV